MAPVARNTATLLVSCPDASGLVARFANFVHDNGGNIIHSDNHADLDAGVFLTRLEWDLNESFALKAEEIGPHFEKHIAPKNSSWRVSFSHARKKMAIWVSKQDHCLFDLLLRHRAGELHADIAYVASNHQNLAPIAEQLGIPFYCVPIEPGNLSSKTQAEDKHRKLAQEYKIDLIVLAK